MTSRYPTNIFGQPVGSTASTPSVPTIDTSGFLQKSGGTMTGNINLGDNKIISSAVAIDDDDIPNKKQTENATNLKTGTINKDRIPQTLNSFGLNSGSIFLKNPSDNTGFIREVAIPGVGGSTIYTHIDGSQGITMSIGGTTQNVHYMTMKSNKVFFNQKDVDHIKLLKADNIKTDSVTTKDQTVSNQLKFKEVRSDNTTEPIIINDSGMTLDDHILRFRGSSDNHHSIRWFNGDLVNGRARLEVSTTDRLRLSTCRGKDGVQTMKNGNRDYTGDKAQFIELLHDKLDVNKNRIVNLSTPIDPFDAATKEYVDYKLNYDKTKDYRKIITDHSPSFWISSKFPKGFDNNGNTIQDLTGAGLTISGTVTNDLKFGLTSRIRSTGHYTTDFTFIVKAKRTSTRGGRLLSSTTGNSVFAWWSTYNTCLWMASEVYGILTQPLTADDRTTKVFMMTCQNDRKILYRDKTQIVSSTAGSNTWNGNLVVGYPVNQSNENSEFQVYEVIAFPSALTAAQLTNIYDKILV